MKKIFFIFLALVSFCLCGCNTSNKKNTNQEITSYDGIYKFYSLRMKYEDLNEREEYRIDYDTYKEDGDPSFDDAYPVSVELKVNQTYQGVTIKEDDIYCVVSGNSFRLYAHEDLGDPEEKTISMEANITFDKNSFVVEFPEKIYTYQNKVQTFLGSVYINGNYQYLKSKIFDGRRYSEEFIVRKAL